MGKSKKSRRNFRENPSTSTSSNRGEHLQGDARSILSDITSFEEKRRLKACRLLSTVYSINSHNVTALERLTSAEILSKLSMRLVDSSADVKYEAVGAVRNIAVARFPHICLKILECGALDIIITLTAECLRQGENPAMCNQLLSCLANLVSSHEDIAIKFSLQSASLIPSLLLIISRDTDENVKLAAANLMCVASDNIDNVCEVIVGSQGIEALLRCGLQPTVPATVVSASIGIKCLSVVVNVCSCCVTKAPAVLSGCMLTDIVAAVVGSLRADSQLFIALASIVTEDDREEVAPAEGTDDDVEVMQSSAVDDVDAAKPAGGSAGATTTAEAAADTASRNLQDREALFDILKSSAEILANLGCLIHDDAAETAAGLLAGATGGVDDSAGGGGGGGMVAEDDLDETGYSVAAAGGAAADPELRVRPELAAVAACLADVRVAASVLQALEAMSVVVVRAIQAAHVSKALPDMLEALDRLCSGAGNLIPCLSLEALEPSFSQQCLSLFARVFECQNDLIGTIRAAPADSVSLASTDTSAVIRASKEVAASAAEGIAALCRRAPVPVLQYLAGHGGAVHSAAAGGSAMAGTTVGAGAAAAGGGGESSLQPLALLLCKGATSPDCAIVIPCLEAMAALGGKDSEAEAQLGAAGSIVTARINALLSNAALRKIEENVTLGTPEALLVTNACFAAMIDMHSSDDASYLQNFAKLNANARLAAGLQTCRQAFAALKRSSPAALTGEEREQIKETLVNVKRFVAYKQQFLG